jgi:hypothetical protein
LGTILPESNFVSVRHFTEEETMALPAVKKSKKEEANDSIIDEISNDTKGFIDRVLGDVGKSSATKQLLLGSISGW